MIRKLTPEEVIYNINFRNKGTSKFNIYDKLYVDIKRGIDIKDKGYNIYLVDNFSDEMLNNIKSYVNYILSKRDRPKDICYVTGEDENEPESMILNNGFGQKLYKCIEDIKKVYKDIIYKFYNSLDIEERDLVIEEARSNKKNVINKILEEAEEAGFELKTSEAGFNFIPLKEGKAITEDEYEALNEEEKENILSNMKKLKNSTKVVFEKLKTIEEKELEDLKECFKDYIENNIEGKKYAHMSEFETIPEAVVYIYKVFDDIKEEVIKNYTSNYEKDSERIFSLLLKYYVNVIVDNSSNDKPVVIFEDDPKLSNLLGNVEYKNLNGNYVTDLSLIKAGSILKANEGCIIIRVRDLIEKTHSYYYLKKVLLNEKIRFDYNKDHFEIISLKGLLPKPVKINVKVILIGDYETYNILYNLDEDFRELFRIKAEFNPVVDIDENSIRCVEKMVDTFLHCKNNKEISTSAFKEICKHLSRIADDRNRLHILPKEIKRILTLTCNNADKDSDKYINDENVRKVIYKEEIIEEEIIKNYKDNKILMDFFGEKIGQINALSVISFGYKDMGKPIRVTCTCQKGNGNIIDIQKENSMSGNIHSKSISILKGLLGEIFGGYDRLPVDFYLSFEQVYGKLEGDSASVAETVCMLSALSKVPIKQNVGVTGSINQFGEIQPVGGVKDKIEGFYKIANLYRRNEAYSVIIPQSNMDSIVLNYEVEKAVIEKRFNIFTAENIKDAVEILMDSNWEEVNKKAKLEMKKYEIKRERRH
ncbi:AAA family ATPase [Clostridium felsineum]|uniref:endopeptidase La n=1 Tax=Clostridium felsineum TaxID=36839 RepID=A0A1S8L0D5_9CLOT|nr:Lon protease family protein [Clostridium felsineum]URZ06358.1 Lon protease [Clostridium felsineum]URZ11393.1 Lon protease [Clostridium felsineum]